MTQNIKDKLIRLFSKTCDNFEIPRPEDIPVRERRSIEKLISRKYNIIDDVNAEIDNDHLFGVHGFNFKEEPPIGICGIHARYYIKYGKLIPLFGYLYWGDFRKRKKYVDILRKQKKVDDIYEETLEKIVYFSDYKYAIFQGSLFTEITYDEYISLKEQYMNSIPKYDTYLLDKRLNKRSLDV